MCGILVHVATRREAPRWRSPIRAQKYLLPNSPRPDVFALRSEREAQSARTGGRLYWSGKSSRLVGLRCVGERGRPTVGHQATPTGLPLRELRTVLFPIYKTR